MDSKNIINRPFLGIVFWLITTVFSVGFSYSQDGGGDPAKGKTLFNSNCAACHKLNKKMVGPALAGVLERREKDWIVKWIHNSSLMIKSGDAEAVKIFEEYNKVPMPAFPQLSEADIDDILAYTEAPAAKPAASEAQAATTVVQAEPGVSTEVFLWIIIAILLLVSAIAYRVNKHLETIVQAAGVQVEKKPFKIPVFVKFVTVVVAIITVIYFLYGYLMQVGVDQGYQPIQPIHFSHKIHAGDNKIECLYCHSSARVSKTSGIPSLNICMNCHKNISEYAGEEDLESGYTQEFYTAEIEKLYAAAGWNPNSQSYSGQAKAVKWVRIHNLPDFVYFNHSQHVSVAGVECQKCHGPIEEMEIVHQHSPLTMGWCVNCHKETNVKMEGNAYYAKIHGELSKKYGVDKLTIAQMGGLECGKCHY